MSDDDRHSEWRNSRARWEGLSNEMMDALTSSLSSEAFAVAFAFCFVFVFFYRSRKKASEVVRFEEFQYPWFCFNFLFLWFSDLSFGEDEGQLSTFLSGSPSPVASFKDEPNMMC